METGKQFIHQSTEVTNHGNTTEKLDGNKKTSFIFLFRNLLLTLQKIKMESRFYEFSQNNTGGSFVTDSKLCHRLFIEADSVRDAIDKAEDLGCYWNGVEEGYDCECCGDRWYPSTDAVDMDNENKRYGGYQISEWVTGNETPENALNDLVSRYKGSVWTEGPSVSIKYGSNVVEGRIQLDSIEQYAQIMADLYGWTKPDCRIFYKNGDVKEIYSAKVK